MHYCFIINAEPSKAGNADKIQADINNLEESIDYKIYHTTAEKSATVFVKEYCAEHLKDEVYPSSTLPYLVQTFAHDEGICL